MDNGFGLEVEFTLTANQFVHRLQMESSYDLETWQKKEIYPGNEGEDWISFLSYPLGSPFYRAGVSFPVINLFQDTVQVANGRQSTQVSFGFSDPAFPFDPPELEVVSSDQTLIPQENIHVIRST
ncbi:MAG: hypothetical protein KJT03_16245, partial [Verrucomicrobiae bacterium]|nr:hypothetical protein [Verrucomicrobiae bacterium]